MIAHCVKSVCIRSYSGLHFPPFRVNTKRYGDFRIQSKCRKMRTRTTPNMDTFHAVNNLRHERVNALITGTSKLHVGLVAPVT